MLFDGFQLCTVGPTATLLLQYLLHSVADAVANLDRVRILFWLGTLDMPKDKLLQWIFHANETQRNLCLPL